jgi:predicted DNA-binding transcriptional regulator AlpA
MSDTATPLLQPDHAVAWTPDDVAAYLRISLRHLNDVRAEDPGFPAPRMIGSLPRWHASAIAEWLATAAEAPSPTSRARASQQRGRGHRVS